MQAVNGHIQTQRSPQRVTPALSILDLFTRWFTVTLVTALLMILAFDVAPSLRESAAALREYRQNRDRHDAEEIRRLKLLEDARTRQVNNEAALLVQQEENLRRAREISKTLKGE